MTQKYSGATLTLIFRVYLRQLYDISPRFVEMRSKLDSMFPSSEYLITSSDLEEYRTPILEDRPGLTTMKLSHGGLSQSYYIIREQIFVVTPRFGKFPEDSVVHDEKLSDFAVVKLTNTYENESEAV